MAKPRKHGRPTKIEALIHKIETTLLAMDEKAADSLMEMYNVMEAVARNTSATDASRMKAAEWIIKRGEEFLKAQEEDEQSTQDAAEDFSRPLISSTFGESKSH